jgi:hypothetical protein
MLAGFLMLAHRRLSPSLAFNKSYNLVYGDILEYFDAAAYPANLDAVDFFTIAQSKVKTRAVMALVSAPAVNFVYKS